MKNKNSVVAALDPENNNFVAYIASFAIFNKVHSLRRAQIALLKVDKALTIILPKYFVFANIFSSELAVELLKHMEIKNYIMNLVNGKQPLYRPISYLGQ